MSKIKNLFNFLTFGTFFSVIILFVADLLGFSLNINFNLFSRILVALLVLGLLINIRDIKNLFFGLKDFKKFILLSLINILLISLFLMFYPMFRFGSPLVWEDRIPNFKAAKKVEINLNKPLRRSFQAKSNNFGTIGLKIISQDIIIGEEEEINNKEKADLVQGMKIEGGDLNEEFNEKLFLGEPDKIVFRIRKEESKDYFYENTYELNQYWQTNYFLFGFPIQYSSEGKSYVFEIEKIEEGETGKRFLLEINSEGNFNFYPRYIYNLASLKTDWEPIWKNIGCKTNQFLEERTTQVNLIVIFLLIEVFIIFFLKKEEKYFKEKIVPILDYFLFFSLFLTILPSLCFLNFNFLNTTFCRKAIDLFLYYGVNLILIIFSIVLFAILLNKEKIEKVLPEEFFLKIRKWRYLILFFILVIGGFFYFYKIGSFSLQMDEFFHARAVKAYFEDGQLFSYNRSRFTTLLGIISTHFFRILNLNFSDEFVLRFPIAFFGLINVILIYLISKLYTNKKLALFISLIFATEIWIIYFARYLRFYTPAITLILLVMFLIKRYKFSIKFISLSFFMAIIGYFYIENYLLILIIWLCFLLIIRLVEEKKILMAIPIFFIGGYLVLNRIVNAFASGSVYNLISWSFNPTNMKVFFLWLSFNYGFCFILSLAIVPILIFSLFKKGFIKQIKKYFLEYYLLINLILLFFYIAHVPFNFTFRPILFFLPLMFIVGLNYLYKCLKDKKFFYIFFSFVLILNLAFGIKYKVDSNGDKYFPTKLVYERIDIATGNNDMANFLNSYIEHNNMQNHLIHYIGLGGDNLRYYLNEDIAKNDLLTYRYSARSDSKLSDFTNFLEEHPDKKHIIVINANAYPNRINYTYSIFLNRKIVTEANSDFVNYVENNEEFKNIYVSKDNYSKIFEFNPQTSIKESF